MVKEAGAAYNVGNVLATTRYPVEPFGVKLTVAPDGVTPVKEMPVGWVVGATAAGLLTSTGLFAEHTPVL